VQPTAGIVEIDVTLSEKDRNTVEKFLNLLGRDVEILKEAMLLVRVKVKKG
jgi:hypothetical protein